MGAYPIFDTFLWPCMVVQQCTATSSSSVLWLHYKIWSQRKWRRGEGDTNYSSLACLLVPRLDSLLDHNSTTKATSKEVDEILAHSNNGD